MRVLRRFTKPGDHVAEIRERTVTTFKALEWMVFVDGSLLESELFHGERLPLYQSALDARVAQFVHGGWSEEQVPSNQRHLTVGPVVAGRHRCSKLSLKGWP
jgi:hypothetical protein